MQTLGTPGLWVSPAAEAHGAGGGGARNKARQEAGRHRFQKAPELFLSTPCSEGNGKLGFLGRRSDLLTL